MRERERELFSGGGTSCLPDLILLRGKIPRPGEEVCAEEIDYGFVAENLRAEDVCSDALVMV